MRRNAWIVLAASLFVMTRNATATEDATPSPSATAAPSADASPSATPAAAASPVETPAPVPAAAGMPRSATLPFDLHGGALLWQYLPFVKGHKPYASIYVAYLTLDKHTDDFGLHFEPRFRDTKLRPFFNSNVWIQEAYVSWNGLGKFGVLKAGKEYTHFGYFWDGSFYGNLPYFDGITLDPDVGISLEGEPEITSGIGLEYAAQFMPNDGGTNGSLAGRDALSEGARQRNEVIARVAPFYKIGRDGKAQIGASYQSFNVEEPAGTPNEKVTRFEVDANVKYAGARAFGEYIAQDGRHVLNYPATGLGSKKNDYVWIGIGYTWHALDFRYNVTQANYTDVKYQETVHTPGLVVALNPDFSVMLEYVYWSARSTAPGSKKEAILDRSGNLVLIGSF